MSTKRPDAEIELVSPFPLSELPLAWSWIKQFRRSVADDFAPQTFNQFLIQERARQGQAASYGVVRQGELGGIVWVDVESPVIARAHCIFKREFWGRNTVLPALNLIADGVFEAGIHKIVMPVFADNRAIRSVCRALGAEQEGYLRQHTLRDGQMVDMVLFGLLATDRPASTEIDELEDEE